jgi:ABC-type spermidine/putrescine transport system permease subunit II
VRATRTAARRQDPLASPLLSLPAVLSIFVGLCVPLGVLLAYSLWPSVNGKVFVGHWTLSNYAAFFNDPIYWKTLLRSFWFTSVAALVTVLAAFPFAYFIAFRVPPRRRIWWIAIAMLPFSASYLIRVFAWLTLLGDRGIINTALTRLHLVHDPLAIFGYGRTAIVLTFVYLFFPLAFIMTFVTIERIDPALLDSAADLGAGPLRVIARIVVPMARTGLLAAFAFCVISMMGDYFTATLIGGTNGTLFSTFIQSKFGFSLQWGFGSALAYILFASILMFLFVARRATGALESIGAFSRSYSSKRSPLLLAYALLALVFIYTPIAMVVLLAFNDSEFTGLPITGLTLQWFTDAIHDPVLLDALHLSLYVAGWSLAISLVIGTPAAVQLARTRGHFRSMAIGLLALPIILPAIMIGLGIVISLHALGVPRGLWTIIIAHSLFIMPVVIFIILVRLEGMDPDFELAAMDLGAKPWRAFLWITVPEALPAIVAAGLIGFAMSLDEFVVTYLVTGTQVTLPLFIFSSLRYQITPELNALSAMMVGASFVLCLVAFLVLAGSRRLARRRSRSGRAA